MSKEKTREQILEEITEVPEWEYHSKTIKEDYLNELEECAENEGSEWGETVLPLIECYRNTHYASKEFNDCLYNELASYYITMVEQTELIEEPEKQVTATQPARKYREWV